MSEQRITLKVSTPFDLTYSRETYLIYPRSADGDVLVRTFRCGLKGNIVLDLLTTHTEIWAAPFSTELGERSGARQ